MDSPNDKRREAAARDARVRRQLIDAILSRASLGADASDEGLLSLAQAYHTLKERSASAFVEPLAELQAALIEALGGRLSDTKDQSVDLHALARAFCLVA